MKGPGGWNGEGNDEKPPRSQSYPGRLAFIPHLRDRHGYSLESRSAAAAFWFPASTRFGFRDYLEKKIRGL